MTAELTAFLQRHVDSSANGLVLLGAGMFSKAYRFDTKTGSFVFRIGVTREAFEKDQLAYARLGHVVPVPKILTIGAYDDARFYCISAWFPGQILTSFDKAGTEQLLPALFNALWAMSQVPVGLDSSGHLIGFGILNGEGNPRQVYASWADFIGAVEDFPRTFTPRGDEVYKPWDDLYATTFLDKTIVQDAYQRLCDLLPFLPNERHYVHGDFGYDNALAVGHQITAILDWAELRCGDWLYDLAYIAYYDDTGTDYIGTFIQFAMAKELALPAFRERIQACYLHIFLGNIFLEANRNQRDWYEEDLLRYKRLVLVA